MERILGIDLGTTNSLVAIQRDGKAVVLPDGESPLIPSIVAYDPEGRMRAVGQRARTLKTLDSKGVLYSVKRLMGSGKADLEKVAGDLPFDFGPSTEEMIRIQVGSRAITPIEVSADILRRCKFVAENQLGAEVSKAVITVPAYFNDAQRIATSVAGKLAGLEVVRIVNEPTAAALAYGLGLGDGSRRIAVYDFGGGTFDVSILKVVDGTFEVLSTDGDTHLGGDDLDASIAEFFFSQVKVRPSTSEDLTLVSAQIELLKRQLSDVSEIDFQLHWGGVIRWQGIVSRHQIESAMEPTIQRTLELCRSALERAQLSSSDLDDVILVGGSTRIPMVRQKVEEFFGKLAHRDIDPDQVVALGAAVQGSILSGEEKRALLLDVVPLSLGLETMGGVVAKIIARNTTIPCVVSEFFTTSVDNQTAVDLKIVQGERELSSQCRALAQFKLRIPPALAGTPKIKVSFILDANGVLRVRAINEKTKEESSIEVRPSFGLKDEEVEQMLKDAWENAERDFAERQLIEARLQAQSLIRACEKTLLNPLLDPAYRSLQQQKMDPVIRALKEDIQSAKSEVIIARTKELDVLTQDLAQRVLDLSVQNRLQNQRLENLS